MTEPARTAKIDSSCLGVCVIDARIAACYGCFRTIAEIAAWPSATPTEQRAILAAMDMRRRKAMPPKPGSGSMQGINPVNPPDSNC